MTVLRVDHIDMIVADLDAHVAFMKLLGFRVLRTTPHHGRAVEMALPGAQQVVFELHQVAGEENPGINHIAFLVDDVRETYAELKATGLQFEDNPPGFGEPEDFPETGRTLAHFRDPGGWRMQLTSVAKK